MRSSLKAILLLWQTLLLSALLQTHGEPALSQIASRPVAAEVTGSPNYKPPFKYIGNSFSLKFHRPSCPFAQAMGASHLVFFRFRRDAVTAGMAPCRYCLPPFWTTVRARIIQVPNNREQDQNNHDPGSINHDPGSVDHEPPASGVDAGATVKDDRSALSPARDCIRSTKTAPETNNRSSADPPHTTYDTNAQ